MRLLGTVLAITALAGIGGTGLGGLTACLLRRDSEKTISLLLSFAAGVMTAVVCFDLLTDAVKPENSATPTGIWMVAAGVLVGYAAVAVLNAWIDGRAGLTGGNGAPGGPGTGGRARSLLVAGAVMAAAIALHNVPEGMVIGASFARETAARSPVREGLVLAAVIGLHNIPEGMAVAVPLISGSMPKVKTVLITAATGAPTVLGALAGYCLGTIGPRMLALSLSFASGAMLYVVFGELLPESSQMWHSHLPALAAVIGMLVGLVIVYA